MENQPTRLVFVSHSSQDIWIAKQLAREIEACGARPFLDEAEIHIGEIFEEVIRDNLNKADELVVLVTPWALNRRYVWMELGAAWCRRIPIVALLVGMTPTEIAGIPDLPILLKSKNLISLNQVDLYFEQLRQRVRGASIGPEESL